MYRILIEIRQIHLQDLRVQLERVRDNRRINAEYLAGLLTDDQWKKKLSKNELSRIVYNEALEALDAFANVSRDIFMQMASEIDKDRKIKNHSAKITADDAVVFAKNYQIADEQFNALIKIYNDKIFQLIKVYKIPCKLLVESTDNGTYRLITFTHSEIKRTVLMDDGTIEQMPPTPQTLDGRTMDLLNSLDSDSDSHSDSHSDSDSDSTDDN